MMSDCSLTNTQSEANPGFNFARFEKGTRYYTIILDRDLFDDWVIIIANGRIGTKLGRIRTLAFPSFTAAFNQFCIATKIRIKRGYQLETYSIHDSLSVYMLA
jgi:hypothetical protein